jgi:hypothetical protein
MHRARAFDREWFDTAHGFHVALLVQQHLASFQEMVNHG